MEDGGHAVETRAGIGQDHFGGLECLAGLQPPCALLHAAQHAGMAVGVLLSQHAEAAAVHHRQTVAGTGELGGIGLHQGNEGIMLMAAGAAAAADLADAVHGADALHAALLGPGAVEVEQIELAPEGDAGACGVAEGDLRVAAVDQADALGEGMEIVHDGIGQLSLQAGLGILHAEDEGFGLTLALHVHGGKTWEKLLALDDLIALIIEDSAVGAVGTDCAQGNRAEIAAAAGGIGEGGQLQLAVEGGQIAAALADDVIQRTVPEGRAPVQLVDSIAARRIRADLENIAEMAAIRQMEGLCPGINHNRHGHAPFVCGGTSLPLCWVCSTKDGTFLHA